MDDTMDPTDFLKETTSHHSNRTVDTEEATQQASFSSTDGSFASGASASGGLDFDLHNVTMAGSNATAHQRHNFYDSFRGNESTDSFMLEDSFALGESFSCGVDGEGPSSLLMGETGSPRRPVRERPDLSTVIDIEEDQEGFGESMDDGDDAFVVANRATLKPQTSNISVDAKQG